MSFPKESLRRLGTFYVYEGSWTHGVVVRFSNQWWQNTVYDVRWRKVETWSWSWSCGREKSESEFY